MTQPTPGIRPQRLWCSPFLTGISQRDWKNPWQLSNLQVSLWAEICTWDIPKTRQKHYTFNHDVRTLDC